MEQPQTLSPQERPGLDEATFQQLLEAAYVLQEQSGQRPDDDPQRGSRAKPDPVEALSEIVEAQELLRSQPYELPAAANLIAQRLAKITNATGVAIAIVREDHLEYCAATGSIASLAGTRLPWDSNLSAGSAQPGLQPGGPEEQETFSSPIANSLPSTQVCEENSVKSPFLIPIHHEGKVAGLLELRFANPDSIEEQDIQSCRLMAGLMSEAITREAELQWKQALAAERATMLGALERIKPQLERLAVEPATETKERAEARTPAAGSAEIAVPVPTAVDVVCRQCGFQFAGEKDLFCGRCGAPRALESWPVDNLRRKDDLQSKFDSPWHSPRAAEQQGEGLGQQIEEAQNWGGEAEAGLHLTSEASLSPASEEFSEEAEPAIEGDSALVVSGPAAEGDISLTAVRSNQLSHAPWASAAKTHRWLQSLDADAPERIWLTKHRANIYVGAALILFLVVLSGWGTPPRYHGAQGRNQLTLSDRLLLSLGLAEAPPTPVYHGNPNTQVWIDVHTALYYCPGSDLYGKTPGGKFTTQRDAQLDQFEPAARKSCD